MTVIITRRNSTINELLNQMLCGLFGYQEIDMNNTSQISIELTYNHISNIKITWKQIKVYCIAKIHK